jgi:hypothetical protein
MLFEDGTYEMAYYDVPCTEIVFVQRDTPIVREDLESALESDLARQSADIRAMCASVSRISAYSLDLLFPRVVTQSRATDVSMSHGVKP